MSHPDANSPTNSLTESQSSLPHSQATARKILTTLKTRTIGTLRSTSRILESAADRVEAANELNPLLVKIATGLTIAAERFLPVWRKLLTVIRDRLPATLTGKLGDRALSGIVAGAIVVLFWFTSSLFASKPPQPVQVASRPPVTVPVQPTQFPTNLTTPEAAPEIVSTPVEVIEPAEVPVIAAVPVIEEVEPAEVSVAEAPVEPSTIEPISEPAPELFVPEPIVEEPMVEAASQPESVAEPISTSPEPELTPEQKQVAAIQSQIMEISDRFIGGLVMGVEPQIDRAQIKVRVSEDWYRFSAEQQDQFANELWARSQTFDLPRLEITDAQGSLLARPPIVGETMIILKRKAALS
ncbi:hypothetical protein [Leptolyngbya sp. FACHB-17]|uniref:hypothetical protein n=1 Tax=unclassified Leptolyngbya TaxID=2650499 RepID=UPI001680AFCB|nr:hypothetical protein [Leptolyngbya sp. FACHB-17]MBD2078701.1 hypothetical protein [Leptolyngbya sp. FACHB-17]